MVAVFGVGVCRSSVIMILISFCVVASPAVFPANGVLIVHGSESRAACIRDPNQTSYAGLPIATQCCWQSPSVQRMLHKPEYPYPYNLPPFDVRHQDRGLKHSCYLDRLYSSAYCSGGGWCAHTARQWSVPNHRVGGDAYDANCRFGVYIPPGATRNRAAAQTMSPCSCPFLSLVRSSNHESFITRSDLSSLLSEPLRAGS